MLTRTATSLLVAVASLLGSPAAAGEREDYYICVSEEIGRGTDLAQIGDLCLGRARRAPEPPRPEPAPTPTPQQPAEEYPFVESLRDALSAEGSLFDPVSAQFKDLVKSRSQNAWCGQINAKNRYGGYVGWKYFAIKDRYRGVGNRREYIDLTMGDKGAVEPACKRYRAWDRRYW